MAKPKFEGKEGYVGASDIEGYVRPEQVDAPLIHNVGGWICFICGADWNGNPDKRSMKWYEVDGEVICSICWLWNWEDPEAAVDRARAMKAQKTLFDLESTAPGGVK